jgi:tetratricopeptide (TPR) repeat protein
LGLLTQSRLAELTFDQPGQYVAAKLEPLIRQVRSLVEKKEGVWDAETLAGVRFGLATALAQDGEQTGNSEPLAESIGLYRLLDEYTRARVPLDWAVTQNNLGLALWRFGERESGTARLEEAVAAYREALQGRTRARVPLQWAIGIALWRLGERESGTARLEEAAAAFREALQENTRARVPHQWAMTRIISAMRSECSESGTARRRSCPSVYWPEGQRERCRGKRHVSNVWPTWVAYFQPHSFDWAALTPISVIAVSY